MLPVLLQTPYGIARSTFTAVGRDHKLNEKGKAIAGKVGHDRIQGQESIGEAGIRIGSLKSEN